MVGKMMLLYRRDIPAGEEAMDPIHEGRIVSHFGRKRAKKMSDSLLVLYVHIEVSYHHHRSLGGDKIFTPAELAGFHVALHDVDAVLLVEGDAGNLVEADDVVLGTSKN